MNRYNNSKIASRYLNRTKTISLTILSHIYKKHYDIKKFNAITRNILTSVLKNKKCYDHLKKKHKKLDEDILRRIDKLNVFYEDIIIHPLKNEILKKIKNIKINNRSGLIKKILNGENLDFLLDEICSSKLFLHDLKFEELLSFIKLLKEKSSFEDYCRRLAHLLTYHGSDYKFGSTYKYPFKEMFPTEAHINRFFEHGLELWAKGWGDISKYYNDLKYAPSEKVIGLAKCRVFDFQYYKIKQMNKTTMRDIILLKWGDFKKYYKGEITENITRYYIHNVCLDIITGFGNFDKELKEYTKKFNIDCFEYLYLPISFKELYDGEYDYDFCLKLLEYIKINGYVDNLKYYSLVIKITKYDRNILELASYGFMELMMECIDNKFEPTEEQAIRLISFKYVNYNSNYPPKNITDIENGLKENKKIMNLIKNYISMGSQKFYDKFILKNIGIPDLWKLIGIEPSKVNKDLLNKAYEGKSFLAVSSRLDNIYEIYPEYKDLIEKTTLISKSDATIVDVDLSFLPKKRYKNIEYVILMSQFINNFRKTKKSLNIKLIWSMALILRDIPESTILQLFKFNFYINKSLSELVNQINGINNQESTIERIKEERSKFLQDIDVKYFENKIDSQKDKTNNL